MVRKLFIIEEDSAVTLGFSSLKLGVSYGSLHDIVDEYLGLRKVCSMDIQFADGRSEDRTGVDLLSLANGV